MFLAVILMCFSTTIDTCSFSVAPVLFADRQFCEDASRIAKRNFEAQYEGISISITNHCLPISRGIET